MEDKKQRDISLLNPTPTASGIAKLTKAELLQQLQDLEDDNVEGLEETDNSIQAEKGYDETKEETITAPISTPITKKKKPRSQKQIDAFARALEIKKEKALARKAERDLNAGLEKVKLEEKIVKKAVAIKKKQIKKQIALDDISDDDTPLEEIKKIVKKFPAKKEREEQNDLPPRVREPPKYLFY